MKKKLEDHFAEKSKWNMLYIIAGRTTGLCSGNAKQEENIRMRVCVGG